MRLMVISGSAFFVIYGKSPKNSSHAIYAPLYFLGAAFVRSIFSKNIEFGEIETQFFFCVYWRRRDVFRIFATPCLVLEQVFSFLHRGLLFSLHLTT